MIKQLLNRMFMKTIILSNSADGTHADGKMSYAAQAAISNKYCFGKLTTTAGQIALAGSGNTSTGARAIGVISDEADAANDYVGVSIIGEGGTLKALASGSIAIGDFITSDASSQAVSFTAMSGGAGTFYIYGIALTAASAGDRVEFVATPGLTQTK